MSWRLSRFRAGDLVEIRGREEILATLDANGCIDGMPFMPEMLQFCGQRIRVGAVAHKTCDTAKRTYTGRRLETMVHLGDLRCDGSAHGGCQAACKLFWRDEWLRGVDEPAEAVTAPPRNGRGRCDEATLAAKTRQPPRAGETEPRYACQATELYSATTHLQSWNPRQYLRDVVTGNHSVGTVLRTVWLGVMGWWLRYTPWGYRAVKVVRDATYRWLAGEVPDVRGTIPVGQPTPTGHLGLQPGDRVRIKRKEEIVETIREDNNRNRGLSFDKEMLPYCGRTTTVRDTVTRIINEGTGEMMHMKQPCIILDGVVCGAKYSECRLLCPRELPSFWRELWLERVDEPEPALAHAYAQLANEHEERPA